MAVEWRSVCGVMFRPRREVQSRWAIATARSSRSRTPERDIAVPCRLGNTGASGASSILFRHARSSVAVFFHSGMTRSLRPLPWRCTARRSTSTSCSRSAVTSETRAPVF